MPQIVRMAYTRVAHDALLRPQEARAHDSRVDAFLLDHMEALRASADGGDAPVTAFFDPTAQDLFEVLRTGGEREFLAAADGLAAKLVGEMDGRSGPGLLVCVQVSDGGELSGAALKLEVVAPNSAVLEALDSGEEVLSGATNVLDSPGKLQKGALVPDPRGASAVVIGDKLARDAAYFPRAFGIRPEQRAADTAADLVEAIAAVDPAAARAAARALPGVESGAARNVLAGLGEHVPALDDDVQEAVLGRLTAAPRPVVTVDTGGSVREILRADGITITGTAAAMRAVDVDPDPQGGGYVITIRVADEPRRTFRR